MEKKDTPIKNYEQIEKRLKELRHDKETWSGEIRKPINFVWQMSKDYGSCSIYGKNLTKVEYFAFHLLEVGIKILYPIVRVIRKVKRNA